MDQSLEYNFVDATLYEINYEGKKNIVRTNCTGTYSQENGFTAQGVTFGLATGEGKAPVNNSGSIYYFVGKVNDSKRPFITEPAPYIGGQPGYLAVFQQNQQLTKPKHGKREDDANIEMTFTNFSSVDLNRTYLDSEIQLVLGGLTQSPPQELKANGFSATLGSNQLLSGLDQGPADLYLSYGNVGVWIHFSFQAFGLGFRPIWYVTSDNFNTFKLPGDDPSIGYTWPSSVSDALGVGPITAKPVSGHSSLTVDINIQPKTS